MSLQGSSKSNSPPLPQFVADWFDRLPGDVVQRGQSYFADGAVEIDRASRGRIFFTVAGSHPYLARIRFDADGLQETHCTCVAFERFAFCKHLVAALLKASAEGLLDSESARAEADPRIANDAAGDDAEQEERSDDDNGDAIDEEDELDGQDSDFDLAGPLRLIYEEEYPQPPPPTASGKLPQWKRQFAELRQNLRASMSRAARSQAWNPARRLIYLIDLASSAVREEFVVEIGWQRLNPKNGRWQAPRRSRILLSELAGNPNTEDRQIIQMLHGSLSLFDYQSPDVALEQAYLLEPFSVELLLERICATGRCFARGAVSDDDRPTLKWDADSPPWEFTLAVAPQEGGERYAVAAHLVRAGQDPLAEPTRLPIDGAALLTRSGWAIVDDKIARLKHFGAFDLMKYLATAPTMTLAVQQGDELLSELMALGPLPRLELPDPLQIQRVSHKPRPRLRIYPGKKAPRESNDVRLIADLSFDYDGRSFREGAPPPPFDPATRILLVRDNAAEAAARDQLDSLGVRLQWSLDSRAQERRLPASKLSSVVSHLCGLGWIVQAEGKVYRQPGEFKVSVASGIDWFGLQGELEFGENLRASLPTLLAALRSGQRMVQLDDGSIGVLPEDWLQRYGLLARVANGVAATADGEIRFTKRQVGLLDALLATLPEASSDDVFKNARQQLRDFEGVVAVDPPAEFIGTLRAYQREGLGWMQFLNRFGFGGCLADDMGLGKTVQVLGMLRARKAVGKPSLVVVPRSLIFNWQQEAAKFTPDLRVLDHTGVGRARTAEPFAPGAYDIILTTYGTLRLDIPMLKDVSFDYAILDEAQAIKSAVSESAKACRLIQSDHRLALSGTPIQNHLGELWSLFEFLNPGMLGSASVFRTTGAGSMQIEQESRELLSRALRPFILRRTKEQVARDLPEKTEQTLWCDLEADQRKLYDELRDHYRASLMQRIAADGINRSKIQVLEALLRLRQAACHPGLIDKERSREGSAKLEVLLGHISELMEEGHKVLVFSQFTSFLAIVRQQLDEQKITYEYLDGKTRDRLARVDRFQNDPTCKLFLISLKAGGLGLNLTAAEYVFLLDPWWNPAIEAQAIDRAHRIGQTRKVFAYRIIARDTVEQKVLELQSRKKDLADMILSADNSLIGKLDREDLQLLLS